MQLERPSHSLFCNCSLCKEFWARNEQPNSDDPASDSFDTDASTDEDVFFESLHERGW